LSHSGESINRRLRRQFLQREWRIIEQHYTAHTPTRSPSIAQEVIYEIEKAVGVLNKSHLKALVIEANLGSGGIALPLLDLIKRLIESYPDTHVFLYSGTMEHSSAFNDTMKQLSDEGYNEEQLKLICFADKSATWEKLYGIAGGDAASFDAREDDSSASAGVGFSSATAWGNVTKPLSSSSSPKTAEGSGTAAAKP
ncbi:MAG: hypothetical protein K0S29_611, partial [Gammaproteobacteria bacterium]|nr:hypothetical protein [Gammaproteobacteria bacterium]